MKAGNYTAHLSVFTRSIIFLVAYVLAMITHLVYIHDGSCYHC